MTTQHIVVENIKCGGCANSITISLNKIEGVSDVHVNIETGTIHYTPVQESAVQQVEAALLKMGYPKQGENHLVSKAKSYVSCMVGRMSTAE